MTHDPLPPLTPEEGGLHGGIPDTPAMRAWFQRLGERAQTATHDPLCPDASLTGGGCAPACESCNDCQCDLIAKVRDDERNRVFTHLDALADRDHTEGCPSLTCTGCGA